MTYWVIQCLPEASFNDGHYPTGLIAGAAVVGTFSTVSNFVLN